jgi:hypothetical protein
VKDDVIVFAQRGRFPAVNVEGPRHPQVHDQAGAGGNVGDQILPTPLQRQNRCAFQPRREAQREECAQLAAAHQHVLETGALHRWTELAGGALDFRQFGHRSHPNV